jgi:Putative phage metallopeptidase
MATDFLDDRPMPPEQLREPGFELEPAPELAEWLIRSFVREGSLWTNPRHEHLRKVDLVAMWTNVEYIDGGMPVAGMAEIVKPSGKPWKRADAAYRLCMLHGNVPQARVWMYAPAWTTCDFWTACARGQHELLHFAHKHDREGSPLYDDLERPMLAARAHDVEEFVDIMELYGADACAGRSRDFVEAALRPPKFAPATFRAQPAVCACGARI